LLIAALEQGASVVLVSDLDLPGLPPEVEFQPVSGLAEVARWADYLALDLPRESLPGLNERLGLGEQAEARFEAQALVVTPMPCVGMAECGVCAVTARRGWKMACKDGPVFDLKELT
jgi:dihydroorotate dehydrogenase electron transfer subunit